MIRKHFLFYAMVNAGLNLSILCAVSPCLANTTPDTAQNTVESAAHAALNVYPVLSARKAIKHRPSSVSIYQTDHLPLGKRQPLLLVHGLRAEYRTQCRWKKVIARLTRDQQFNKRYKIYLLRYDSTADLSKTTPMYTDAIMDFYKNVGGTPITVLAMSLGGVLTYTAMQDPDVDSAVRLLFTMATPFHGSPLFCADWFQYSLYKNLSYPLTRVDHSLSYRIYFAHNKNMLSDVNWDNCDGLIPNTGRFRSRLPFGPAGNLNVKDDANEKLAELNRTSTVDKSKFITYGGYLVNPYLSPRLREQVERTILAPYTLITMKVPAHLAREHPVLEMLNREISRIIPAHSCPGAFSWTHPYGLNDGISPVESAVFLPPEVCRLQPLSQESDVIKVKPKVDVRLARIFRDVDHLTFLDGYHPRHSSKTLRDELNPDQPTRPIFDWILVDLLQAGDQTSATIAKEAKLQTDH